MVSILQYLSAKSLSLAVLLASGLIGATCLAGDRQEPNPFGCFNFDFPRLAETVEGQIDALKEIGYRGLAMQLQNEKQFALFDEYARVGKEKDFKIYAGYIVLTIAKDGAVPYDVIDKMIQRLRQVDGKLWLIVKDEKQDGAGMVEVIKTIAKSAQAAGVELVLYPHDNTTIESAEEALGIIEDAKLENVFLTVHLCHEIRAGNGERLDAIIEKVKSYLRLATINGADVDYIDGNSDWSRTIQPLDLGDYDSAKLLKALAKVDYRGPIILHTFGLQKSAPDHHQRSFKRYVEMMK